MADGAEAAESVQPVQERTGWDRSMLLVVGGLVALAATCGAFALGQHGFATMSLTVAAGLFAFCAIGCLLAARVTAEQLELAAVEAAPSA